ncbi:MAG: bifunctional DNA primase/polymerase [Armatimonadetes bacterium]|nr:bifunctional DNA primase/polymerase [Armatimonadota bacterium]
MTNLQSTFSVIPLHSVKNGRCSCGNPDCDKPGKHPRVPWKEFQGRRPTEEEIARWKKQFPGCNWGIVTGQVSGVIVLDIDGPEGAEAIKGKHLPLTWTVQTGKGTHYYFRCPGFPVQDAVRVLPGVDIRADGGYVVAPGSGHASGRKYTWVPGMNPDDLPDGPAPCPKWLLELLQGKRQSGGRRDKINPVNVLNGVPEGMRDATLFKYACRLRTQGLTKEEATRLVLEAARNCQPPFPEETAKEKVESAWKYKNPGEEAKKLDRLPAGITDKELLEKVFPEPIWLIPDLLPTGLTLLAGRSKIGKSWLALNIAVAVASGGRILDRQVKQAGVLYLSLEDTQRRLKDRLSSVLQGAPPPGKITFFTSWPRIDQDGLTLLREWLAANPGTKLVIVDVLQKIRPPRSKNSGVYADDYAVMSSLKSVADEFEIAVLVIHHLNQGASTDFLTLISGSEGIPGGADTSWVLLRERGRADATLKVTGRDIVIDGEAGFALEFDRTTTSWQLLGNAEDYRRSQERQEIIDVLKENLVPMSPKEVAKILGKDYGRVARLMNLMAQDGELTQPAYGKYNQSNNHSMYSKCSKLESIPTVPSSKKRGEVGMEKGNLERTWNGTWNEEIQSGQGFAATWNSWNGNDKNTVKNVPDNFWTQLKSEI